MRELRSQTRQAEYVVSAGLADRFYHSGCSTSSGPTVCSRDNLFKPASQEDEMKFACNKNFP